MLRRGASFSGHERNRCFLNIGTTPFANVSATTGLDHIGDGRAVASVDWDQDGDLDLWIANRTAPRLRFMRNNLSRNNHFLAIRLQGTTCNRDAIGARVKLYIASDPPRVLTQTLRAGDSFVSQSSKWLHFGLGGADQIDRLVVQWPGSGQEEFVGLEPNGRYRIVQQAGKPDKLVAGRATLALTASEPDLPVSTEEARVVMTVTLPLLARQYQDLDGQEQALFDNSTRPVLVNVWASWCQPCVKELGEFTKRASELSATGVRIVALCADAASDGTTVDPIAAGRLIAQMGFPFQTGIASRDLIRELTEIQNRVLYVARPLPLPASFLLTPQGRVVVFYKGSVAVDQLLEDLPLVDARPGDLRSKAFRFDGRDGIGHFDFSPTGAANAYLEGGYLSDARLPLEMFLASRQADIERLKITRFSEQAAKEMTAAYLMLGQITLQEKSYDKARQAYSAAIMLTPDNHQIRAPLALALIHAGRPDDARRHLNILRRRDISDPKTLKMIVEANALLDE